MQTKLLQKLEKTMRLLNSSLDEVDVQLEYRVPNFKDLVTNDSSDLSPYILATYSGERGNIKEKKISLGATALHSSPEDLALHVKQLIGEFKHDVDDIVMG